MCCGQLSVEWLAFAEEQEIGRNGVFYYLCKKKSHELRGLL